jgi:hypothetical protein
MQNIRIWIIYCETACTLDILPLCCKNYSVTCYFLYILHLSTIFIYITKVVNSLQKHL